MTSCHCREEKVIPSTWENNIGLKQILKSAEKVALLFLYKYAIYYYLCLYKYAMLLQTKIPQILLWSSFSALKSEHEAITQLTAGCPWLCMSSLKLIRTWKVFSSYFISLIKSPVCTTPCFSFLVVSLTNDFRLGIQLLPESCVSSCSFNFVQNYVSLAILCSKALIF